MPDLNPSKQGIPRVTKFILVVAGIALSTNAAIALEECREFFTATDLKVSCRNFVARAWSNQVAALGGTPKSGPLYPSKMG